MHVKSILNRVQRFKCFVYGRTVPCGQPRQRAHGHDHERSSSQGSYGACGKRRAGYYRQFVSRREFLPLWVTRVFLPYAPRRVDYNRCGICVKMLP